MTTLNSAIYIGLTVQEDASEKKENFWTRLLSSVGDMIGKSWSYLNEDLGLVDKNDVHFNGGCCC